MAPDHDTITEEADAHKDRHIHTELQSALQVDANELDAPQEKDRQARDTGRGREKDTHAEKEGGRERGKEWEREKVRERERERDNATQSVPLLSAGARQATPIAAHKSLSHSHMGEEQQRQIVEVLLLKSARAGHVGVCLYCVLYCGVSLAAVDERGNTALHLAASQVVRRFLYLCVPALYVSMSLCLYVSMSLCLYVSVSLCLCVSVSLHLYVSFDVTMCCRHTTTHVAALWVVCLHMRVCCCMCASRKKGKTLCLLLYTVAHTFVCTCTHTSASVVTCQKHCSFRYSFYFSFFQLSTSRYVPVCLCMHLQLWLGPLRFSCSDAL